MATLHRQGCVKLILCMGEWWWQAPRRPKEGVEPPGIGVTVVDEPMLGLGTELGSFKRTTNSLEH